jgi:hypothetical protein
MKLFNRRRLQFELSGMLAAVFVASILLALLAQRLRFKERERTAVARLRNAGVIVMYDWEWGDNPHVPRGPQWLRRILGDDFFSNVEEATLSPWDGGGVACRPAMNRKRINLQTSPTSRRKPRSRMRSCCLRDRR